MDRLFDFARTWELLGHGDVQLALVAAALLGLVAGIMAPLIVTRNMAFSVHATSEVSVAGGAAALLLGVGVGYGALGAAVVTALLLGALSMRRAERDSVIGVVLAFGLGIGVLLLWYYPGETDNKFALLTGQIVGVNATRLTLFAVCSAVVLMVLAVVYRPLLFASVDPDVAVARGVPTRALSLVFAVLVGVVTALAVQTVGALLVMALMITPGAASARLTASPVRATALAVLFAEVAMLGGLVLSLAPGAPVSAFVTTVSFVIYLACRVAGKVRSRPRAVVAAPLPARS